jgi:hypothetical protein
MVKRILELLKNNKIINSTRGGERIKKYCETLNDDEYNINNYIYETVKNIIKKRNKSEWKVLTTDIINDKEYDLIYNYILNGDNIEFIKNNLFNHNNSENNELTINISKEFLINKLLNNNDDNWLYLEFYINNIGGYDMITNIIDILKNNWSDVINSEELVYSYLNI